MRTAKVVVGLVALGLAFLSLPLPAVAEGAERAKQAEMAEHAHEEGEFAAHGEEADHEHEEPFNWAEGFLGEKDDAEPSLLWRKKGTPPPFLANIINAVVLFSILIAAGKKPVAEGLKKRKERLIGAMEEAGRMKAEAQKTLGDYENRLQHLDEEIARIRREMREAADLEQKRVLSEAKERRTRMERDAALLVEQERKGARELLIRETVNGALKSAEELLKNSVGPADKDRLTKDFIATIRATSFTMKGGLS